MIKYQPIAILAMALMMTGGCQNRAAFRHVEERGAMNAWIMDTYSQDMIKNAVIKEHSLYAYHFVANSEKLNELGRRSLDTLADHFGSHSGALNVHRGATGEDLYQRRVDHVRARLLEAGVGAGMVEIIDGFPGGAGDTSNRVMVGLESERPKN